MDTHPGHPRDALPGGGHCSPASVSLSFPLCPRRGYVGTGPPVQAWSPVAAAPIPDTQGPGVCPRAACGGASQGLPRPLVPPLPQTQTPRVSVVLPQGAEPSPGPGSPAPTPCVVTRGWAAGAPSSRSTEAKPRPPLCTLQPAAAAQAAPDSRVLDPGGHITSVFTCASSHWSAEGTKGDGATKAGAVGRMRGLIHAPGRGTSRQRAWGRGSAASPASGPGV